MPWWYFVTLGALGAGLFLVGWEMGENNAYKEMARNVANRLPLTEKDAKKEREGKDA